MATIIVKYFIPGSRPKDKPPTQAKEVSITFVADTEYKAERRKREFEEKHPHARELSVKYGD